MSHDHRGVEMLRRLLVLVSTFVVALAASPVAHAAPGVAASGTFTADVDPTTFTFTQQGSTCVITGQGTLVFSGTLEGTATGRTTARVLAPCEKAATSPPGTYQDVFRADLTFTGTLAGAPVEATLTYQGVTKAPDGAITGQMIFSDGLTGGLRVDAVVVQGGVYEGRLVRRS